MFYTSPTFVSAVSVDEEVGRVLVELSKMEQRYDAVMAVIRDGFNVTEVAEKFGVSRQSVYRWIAHYVAGDRGSRSAKLPVPLWLRWAVERTNSWLSNFGRLRRCTDPKIAHRLAQLPLAITFLIAAKLIDVVGRLSL